MSRIRQADSGYTEPYNLVLVPLVPSTVEGYLLEFAQEVLNDLQLLGIRPDALTLRQIADAMFGRRGVDPGDLNTPSRRFSASSHV